MKKSIFVLPDEFEGWIKDLEAREVYYIEGHDSVYVPELNTRIIDKTACREWPDLEGEVVLMTPGEAARLEVKRFYPGTNFRARKSDFALLDISPPMVFSGRQYHGHLWYVDLEGAYASIYRWLTLDCCWPRGTGEMPLKPVADRLWFWKKARNSLIGISRSKEVVGVRGKKRTAVRFHNPLFNPALWHTVQRVLHGIAGLALRNGAIYVSTDCYIFNNARGYARVVQYLEDLDFNLHTGDGDGDIRGWGSYSIEGVKGTARTQATNSKVYNVEKDEGTLKWMERLINYSLKN